VVSGHLYFSMDYEPRAEDLKHARPEGGTLNFSDIQLPSADLWPAQPPSSPELGSQTSAAPLDEATLRAQMKPQLRRPVQRHPLSAAENADASPERKVVTQSLAEAVARHLPPPEAAGTPPTQSQGHVEQNKPQLHVETLEQASAYHAKLIGCHSPTAEELAWQRTVREGQVNPPLSPGQQWKQHQKQLQDARGERLKAAQELFETQTPAQDRCTLHEQYLAHFKKREQAKAQKQRAAYEAVLGDRKIPL